MHSRFQLFQKLCEATQNNRVKVWKVAVFQGSQKSIKQFADVEYSIKQEPENMVKFDHLCCIRNKNKR